MRPRQLRGRLALVGFGAILAGATLGLAAPDARATPLTFVQALNDAGIVVYDATSAISSGYRICDALNHGNGEQVAQQVFTHTTWADVPDLNTARVWVVTSVEQLCPWQDHRGQAVATSAQVA